MKVRMTFISVMAALLVSPLNSPSADQPAVSSESAGSGVKAEIRETAKKAGKDMKEGGSAIVKGAKQVGKTTAESAKEVGNTAKKGFTHADKEARSTVKGKPGDTEPSEK